MHLSVCLTWSFVSFSPFSSSLLFFLSFVPLWNFLSLPVVTTSCSRIKGLKLDAAPLLLFMIYFTMEASSWHIDFVYGWAAVGQTTIPLLEDTNQPSVNEKNEMKKRKSCMLMKTLLQKGGQFNKYQHSNWIKQIRTLKSMHVQMKKKIKLCMHLITDFYPFFILTACTFTKSM